jgi:hypothetical protein
MASIIAHGDDLLHVTVAMMVLTILAVFLRFLTRARSKASFAADDWWVVASLAVFIVYMSLQIHSKRFNHLHGPLLRSK